MWTGIREGFQISAKRRRPFQNCSHSSSHGDTEQDEDADSGARKVLPFSDNQSSAEEGGLGCSSDGSSLLSAEWNLIGEIIAGHKDLFMDLIRPYVGTVYAMAFSLLARKEDAEDVAQEAFLKALAGLKQFRGESTFGTWLIQIAINEARMRNRKLRRIPMYSLNHDKREVKERVPKEFEDWREIPLTALERAEIRDALVRALGSLGQHYREAFLMRDVHGLSISETSAVLGISPGAVKTRLRRARLMLREVLAPGLGRDGRLGWRSKEVRKPWR